MSKVAIVGNASGTGTFTIAAPNSNSDRTLTLPDEAGTVLTSASSIATSQLSGNITQNTGAAFYAYGAGQSLTGGVWTKAVFSNELFDTNSCYDTSTGRFTPNVAGYYIVTGQCGSGSSANYVNLSIYKNGSSHYYSFVMVNGISGLLDPCCGISHMVYCNGSTDYIELYVRFQNSTSTQNGVFSAGMLRGA